MELYNFERANEIMDNVGLARYFRSDENSFRQFCRGGSSLHVKTKRKKQFILYSTATDFSSINGALLKNNKNYVVLKDLKDKDELTMTLQRIQEMGLKMIVLIPNGNKKYHPSSAEQSMPHEVVFYDNESFDFIVEVLANNPNNKVQ